MVTVDGNRAEFSFFRAKAHSVHLIGEFNGWREGDLSMTCDQGYWRAGIRLPVGEYRFHYVADGQHFVDYAAFGIEPGPFGFNSVVRIVSPSPKDVVFGSCQYESTKMTQDTDARRIQVIHRLSEFGFNPQTIDQILLMTDAVMTGCAPLADVMVGVKEAARSRPMSVSTRTDRGETDFSDTMSVVRQQRTETKRKERKEYYVTQSENVT
jgi:hypothetical protein